MGEDELEGGDEGRRDEGREGADGLTERGVEEG